MIRVFYEVKGTPERFLAWVRRATRADFAELNNDHRILHAQAARLCKQQHRQQGRGPSWVEIDGARWTLKDLARAHDAVVAKLKELDPAYRHDTPLLPDCAAHLHEGVGGGAVSPDMSRTRPGHVRDMSPDTSPDVGMGTGIIASLTTSTTVSAIAGPTPMGEAAQAQALEAEATVELPRDVRELERVVPCPFGRPPHLVKGLGRWAWDLWSCPYTRGPRGRARLRLRRLGRVERLAPPAPRDMGHKSQKGPRHGVGGVWG